MDIALWVEFDDSRENRNFHVDDVIRLEAPFEQQDGKGNVLLDCDEKEIWGRVAKSEIRKMERYWPNRIRYSDRIRVEVRALRRRTETH